MKSGWIKLYRQLADNDLWLLEPFTKGQAWVDLLLLANHKPALMTIKNGKIISLERGDCGISILGLADRWQWSREKVKRFLNTLEREKQVSKKEVENRLIIKILNYDVFQDVTLNVTVNESVNESVNVTVNGHKQECKEVKNEKNEKNIYKEQFKIFWQKYPKKTDELKTYSAFYTVLNEKITTFEEIITGLEKYNSYITENNITPQYITSPVNWLQYRKWSDEYTPPRKKSILERIGMT